jgi:DNA-binding LacI/PurR family transcriptional regulator
MRFPGRALTFAATGFNLATMSDEEVPTPRRPQTPPVRPAAGEPASSIRDVALRAKVSTTTVSRAFSDPSLLNHDTLRRVQAVAEEMSYRPNRAARSLTTGKTGNVGVVVPDLGNPFFPAILKGVHARAREADYSVLLVDSDENPRLERQLVRAMIKQVDGVVLCSSRLTEQELVELRDEVTLVLINRRIRDTSAVLLDSADGMRQALEHLAALGHRKIGYLSGPAQSWSNSERRRGLREAAANTDLEIRELGLFQPRFEAGQAAADLVVAAGLTAVIAFNDLMALGVMSRLAGRGVRVPDDISVVGNDDIPMATMATPQLTTVAQPLESAGRAAMELLMEQIAGSDPAGTHEQMLEPQLIVRGSTAPVRTSNAPGASGAAR